MLTQNTVVLVVRACVEKVRLQVEYVPLSWVQPDMMVAQIPYTFRPRPNIPNRVRQRKLNPSFVTMSELFNQNVCYYLSR